jgi:hypothetical protein
MVGQKEAWHSHLAPWLVEWHRKHSEACGGPEIAARYRKLLTTDPKIIRERAFAREEQDQSK